MALFWSLNPGSASIHDLPGYCWPRLVAVPLLTVRMAHELVPRTKGGSLLRHARTMLCRAVWAV